MKGLRLELQHFYWDSITYFYGMGIHSKAKTFDEVIADDPDKFWSKKAGRCRLFGRKLNQLLRENKTKK